MQQWKRIDLLVHGPGKTSLRTTSSALYWSKLFFFRMISNIVLMVEEGEMEITPVHSDEEETEEVLGTKMELIAESSANVIIREHVSVNEHHPVVKELHTLEYPLEQCIYAAERFPEDSYAAHNFLQQIGERGNLFGDEAIEQPLDTLQCSESTTTERYYT